MTWIELRQTQDISDISKNNKNFPAMNEEVEGDILDSILSFKTPELDYLQDVNKT